MDWDDYISAYLSEWAMKKTPPLGLIDIYTVDGWVGEMVRKHKGTDFKFVP